MTRNLKIGNRPIAAMLIAGIVLSGCGQTSDWIKGRISASSAEPELLGAAEIETYISELSQIASGDPAAQAEIFADASSAAQLTPNPSTNLRFGLVLAIPGHPESDPRKAQSILREVMTQDLLLTPAEISLAVIHLNSVERQIVTDTETSRMQEATSRSAQNQGRAMTQRLSTAEAENRRLRQELAEAEQKLEAITTIEQSIRDQD